MTDLQHNTLAKTPEPFRTKMECPFDFQVKGSYFTGGYVFGGIGAAIELPGQEEPSIKVNNDRYIPDYNVWQSLRDLPGGRFAAAAFALYSETRLGAYCVGGQGGAGLLAENVEYRPPPINEWTRRACLNPDQAGDCNPRFFHAGVRLGERGHLFGGKAAGGVALRANSAYDRITDVWTMEPPFPSSGDDALQERGELAAAAIRIFGEPEEEIPSYGFIFGGRPGGATPPFLRECGRYDPVTRTWKRVADLLSFGRSEFSAVALIKDGLEYGHVFGGQIDDTGGVTKWHDRYDPVNNVWAARPPGMAELIVEDGEISGQASFAIRNRGYICGGAGVSYGPVDHGFKRYCHRYDPETNTWLGRADMLPFGRCHLAGVRM